MWTAQIILTELLTQGVKTKPYFKNKKQTLRKETFDLSY
jgi:hypothetical protein